MARTAKALFATVFLLVALGLLHNKRTHLASHGSPQTYTGSVSSEAHAQLKDKFSWDTVGLFTERRECGTLTLT